MLNTYSYPAIFSILEEARGSECKLRQDPGVIYRINIFHTDFLAALHRVSTCQTRSFRIHQYCIENVIADFRLQASSLLLSLQGDNEAKDVSVTGQLFRWDGESNFLKTLLHRLFIPFEGIVAPADSLISPGISSL